jgi:hypothetical protein
VKKVTKKLTIVVENISVPQWNNLVIETNLMASSWSRYGPKIKIQTPNFDRIIERGRAKPGDKILEEDD